MIALGRVARGALALAVATLAGCGGSSHTPGCRVSGAAMMHEAMKAAAVAEPQAPREHDDGETRAVPLTPASATSRSPAAP